jgi:hypothetical protein
MSGEHNARDPGREAEVGPFLSSRPGR